MAASKIATLFINLKAETTHLLTGFTKAERATYKLKQKTNSLERAIKSAILAYASFSAATGFKNQVMETITYADNMGKLAEKLAMSSEELSRLKYAAGYAGVSMDKLNAGLSAMIRRTNNFVRSGGGAAAKALNELGISSEFAKKHFTSTDATLNIILQRLRQMPNGYQKVAIAQDIFSKSASNMAALAGMSADEFARLKKEADEFGITITSSQAGMSASLNDTLDHIQAVGSGYKQTFLLAGIPAILAFSEVIDTKLTGSLKGSSTEVASFENIAVEAIENIIIGFEYGKKAVDVFSMGFDSLELIILGISKGVMELINMIGNAGTVFNPLIRGYNRLAETLGKDKLSLFDDSDLIDTTWTTNKIEKTWEELKKKSLHFSKTSAKDDAKAFIDVFHKTLKDVKTTDWSKHGYKTSPFVLPQTGDNKSPIKKPQVPGYQKAINNIDYKKRLQDIDMKKFVSSHDSDSVFDKFAINSEKLRNEDEYIKLLKEKIATYKTLGGSLDQIRGAEIALEEANIKRGQLSKQVLSDEIDQHGSLLDVIRKTNQSYQKDILTTNQILSKSYKMTFDRASDALANFVATGKLNFKSFTASILQDLSRMYIKQAMIKAVASFGLPGFANGGAFGSQGQIQAYANGGTFTNSIVDKPTFFQHGGALGVMGEAGAEAILPLTRVGKDLGVKAQVAPTNIVVNTYTSKEVQVEHKQEGNTHTLTIKEVDDYIRGQIGAGGNALEKTFSQRYMKRGA